MLPSSILFTPTAQSGDKGNQLNNIYQQLQQWSDTFFMPAGQPVKVDRMLQVHGQPEAAIATYGHTITLLESVNAPHSFQYQVEPLYRRLVKLLLQNIDTLPAVQQQQRLAQCCKVIELLQIAELEYFFREPCQTYSARPIDQLDPQAAVVYSMLLDHQLEVIIAFHNGQLHHHSTPLSPQIRQTTFQTLRQSLNPAFPASRVLAPAQKVYDWLLRPAADALAKHTLKRLIFVVDGYLRNVPMAVLHDGHQFLIERYSIALTPSLQLFDSPGLTTQHVLAGGISAPHQGFRALPAVDVEINQIQAQAPTQVLFNQEFTKTKLAQKVLEQHSAMLHLATHGQFSSKPEETFILTWNNRLNIHELATLLQQREQKTPIEILILSACQTAKGDERAALGMAGVAVYSGARSTVASLWSVDDCSTAALMTEFYQQLHQAKQSRAEALQRAQLSLLNSCYSHPYHWAAFVLIGNWL